METESIPTKSDVSPKPPSSDRCASGNSAEVGLAENPDRTRSLLIAGTSVICLPDSEEDWVCEARVESPPVSANPASYSSTTVLEFVERRFIPEFVSIKRRASRSYFRAILKHVLHPEQVMRAFGASSGRTKNRLTAIPDWPYLDSLRMCEIDAEIIQHLTSTAMKKGYSTQTATHIRNVIRSVFSHAIRTGCYSGPNPASLVTLPSMTRKEPHALSLTQLKEVMNAMRHPEKNIAAFALLTELSVAEICGLQWKYLNLSHSSRLLEDEFVPPRTIAVRLQSYRGEFGAVPESRRRLVRIPELLFSLLRDLKTHSDFTEPQDFVLVSRNGTPIHPENIAARRLKSIGRSFAAPWLSWRVFNRTRINLRSEAGRNLNEELERIFSVQKSTTPHQPIHDVDRA
jgi:integrase